MKFLTAALLVFCLYSAAAGVEFARIHNCRIVIPDDPGEIKKAAADDLKLHLSKSFTAPVKLNGKVPQKITFFIGDSKESRAAGFAPVQHAAEFGISRKGDSFYFSGVDTPKGKLSVLTDECGTFHSVAYFVQKYMQVIFFMPGNSGTFYAKNPEICFDKDKDFPVPSFAMRGFQTAGKGMDSKDMRLFFRRRMGRFPRWSRSNYSYLFLNRWNKRFKHKPEFFALHAGRRVNEKYPRHFPCTSNPEVLEQVISDITAAVKKRPSIKSIRLFCDAPVKSCECANCRNSAAGKLIKGNDHGEVVYSFFSKIAKGVQKYRSDLYFHTQTKAPVYYRVPETETLPPNTVLSLLTGHYVAPDYNWIYKVSDQWRKAGAKVILYAYPRPPAMKTFPLINPHRIADHLKKLRKHAAGSGFAEGSAKVPYSFSALNNFIHSAVLFDADADVDKLIDRFCRFAAPRSHAELKEFYTVMERLLDGAKFWDDPRFNCYTIDRLQKPAAILKKALAEDPENKFLRQLSADFAVFLAETDKTAAAIKYYKKIMAEYESSASFRKLVKVHSSGTVFPLVPFIPCENFQGGTITLSKSGNALKLRAVCRENDLAQVQTLCRKNHEGNIWCDDVVEFFIGDPEQESSYIHLAVNSAGVYRVQLNKKENTGIRLETKSFKGKDFWGVEVTLPESSLSSVMKNGKVKFGAFRFRPSPKQMSALQKSASGNFHDPSGRITLQLR